MTSHSINLISDSDEDEEMIFLNHQSLGKRSRNAESQDAGQEIICLSDDNDRLRNNNTESSSQDPGIVCLSSDDDDENVQEMVATKLFPIFKKKKSCSSPTITNSLLGDLHREREQRQSSSSSSSSSSSTLISSAAKKTHQTIGGNGIYHVKALTKEDAKGIARIQREMEVIMNKFTAAGGTGHAGKIGLKGQGFAPDGQALKTSIQESGQKATKLQLEALRKYKTKTLTFGQLHVQGSKSGKLELSAATKKFDGYYEKLVAWMRQHRPDFEFTTIQVNCNTISKPHRDGGNCGPSVIVGAGAYENGRTGNKRHWYIHVLRSAVMCSITSVLTSCFLSSQFCGRKSRVNMRNCMPLRVIGSCQSMPNAFLVCYNTILLLQHDTTFTVYRYFYYYYQLFLTCTLFFFPPLCMYVCGDMKLCTTYMYTYVCGVPHT